MIARNRNTKDGTQLLADPISRRILAFGAPVVLTLSGVAAAVAGLAGGAGAAYVGGILVLGLGGVLVAIRLLAHAEYLSARSARTVRIERAGATASRALLKRDVVDPVGTALGALIDSVDASAVFLETNSREPADEHGNLTTVRDILYATARTGDPGRWELTGWRVGPRAQEALDAGSDHVTAVADLDPGTVACYKACRIGNEILVPVTAEGRWVGSIGFISADRDRFWTEEERRLLTSTAESIGAYWERRDAKGKLEELLAAKDEFIASVSHEVRTPLTAVLGFAHELDERFDSFSATERSDLIGLIASQSREVANIVDDLLTAARAEAGTLVVAPQVLSMRGLVGEVLSSHSGRVDFAMQQDVDVWADGGRVRQILRNLLTNADRYGGDIVRIHLYEADAKVQLEVRDNGDGVPHHLREHIFEPYARATRGTTQPASVGLGLSVARQLAQMMDGELELSADDDWTVFTLSLPAAASVTEIRHPVAVH